MKYIRFLTLFLTVVLCVFASSAFAFNSFFEFQKDSIEMGDRIMVKWSFLHPNGNVAMPLLDSLGNFQILHQSELNTIDSIGLKKTYRYIHLQQFEPGIYQINGIPLFWNHDGLTDTVFSNSNLLYVKSILVDTTKDIKPIKGPIKIPITWKEILTIVLIILGIVFLILLIIYWLTKIKSKPKQKQVVVSKSKAHEIALKKLQKLESQKKWQSDDSKEYYLELSDILREYLEGRFNIPAKENTTIEILQSLRSGMMQDDEKSMLKEILEISDLVKFAKWKPLTDENYTALKNSIQFVKRTKPVGESIDKEQ